MDSEPKNVPPPETAPAEGGFQPEKSLERIAGMIRENDRIRHRQFYVSLTGAVAILAMLILFLFNLTEFGRNFNRAELGECLLARSSELIQSPEAAMLQRDFRNVFLPAFQKALVEKFTDRLPALRSEVEKEGRDTVTFVRRDLRGRILKRLEDSLKAMEKDLVAKHRNELLSEDEMIKALEDFRAVFLEDVTDLLNQKLASAKQSLAELKDECMAFKELPEYAEIEKMQTGEVENRLVETFLELWIYNLDPERGAKPADPLGGI